MPLFSEHIANMYYGSSSPYTGLPYSYSSSVSPLGSSYSASYLNPGGSYSSHSSLGGYSRAPLTSRWITSSGRNYSPMLSTISERGSASPVRINSPRRIPLSSRTYGTPTYTPRPVNINTADIDVSRDRYRHKVEPPKPQPSPLSQPKESSSNESENGPFMPRVDGKPATGIDSSPGVQRSTIKRGRTVVRLYTIKRKERDSPRKPTEEQEPSDETKPLEEAVVNIEEDTKRDEKEFMKWREKLSKDLTYKDKKEKKSLGAKLVEKFILKDNEKDSEIPATNIQRKELETAESVPVAPATNINLPENKCLDRRCSMELLAEQANILDSLIRSENLSTIDLSKVGVNVPKNNLETFESMKRRKSNDLHNPLKTTKSDHSLHDSLQSYKDVRDPKNFSKRRSIKKSSSGSSLRRLDSITELPKELGNLNLPAIEENRTSIKQENTKQKTKPKLKAKITASVEVSAPMSPLKFIVENVTVEEKPRIPKKKEIIYSSEVDEVPSTSASSNEQVSNICKDQNNVKKIVKSSVNIEPQVPSPEPESGNFWDKIGKRETVYLKKRKQNIDETREKHKRAFFWFPEEEEAENSEETKSIKVTGSNTINDSSVVPNLNQNGVIETNKLTESIQNKNQYNKKISMDADIKKDDSNQIKSGENNATAESPTKNIKIGETNNKVDSTSNAILIEQSDSTSDTSKVKIGSVCEDNTNIGKSASFDTITENKVKVPSQKKTKSEKSKKTSKVAPHSETQSLQPMLPKPNLKTKALEKLCIQQTSEDINKTHTKESDKITTKDSEKSKTPCPIHPFGLQKTKEPMVDSKGFVTEIGQRDVANKQEHIERNKEPILDSNAVETEMVQNNVSDEQAIIGIEKDSTVELKAVVTEKVLSNVSEKQEVAEKVKEAVVETKQVIAENTQNIISDKNKEAYKIKEPIVDPKVVIKRNSRSNDCDKKEAEKETKENKPRAPCPIHPFGLPKTKESSNIDNNMSIPQKDPSITSLESNIAKAIKESSEGNGKIGNGVQLTNEKPTLSNELSKITEAKGVTSKTSSLTKTKNLNVIDKSSAKVESSDNKLSETELSQADKTDNSILSNMPSKREEISDKQLNKMKIKTVELKIPNINKNLKLPHKNVPGGKSKEDTEIRETSNKNNETTGKALVFNKDLSKIDEPSTSAGIELTKQTSVPVTTLLKSPDVNSLIDPSTPSESKTLDVAEKPVVLESQDIPNEKIESKSEVCEEKTREENKAENTNLKDQEKEKPKEEVVVESTPKKPVKEERAVRPLIATPRPLQKKAPQVIHSSDSSDSSSEEESSEEEDEADSSEDSAEFYECDNNPDGRTSTGSNDSGFDSSAPVSPATFSQIKKDCDVNCHRKCEKLTANLCGVNQRMLVEALASRTASKKGGEPSATSSGSVPAQSNNTDILEQELEQSTAYDIFRKTGRFTPPARSIPRFRKYTVEDFQFIKVLGKGSFGKVLLAELRDTEYYYAVKCLKKDVVLEDDDVECTLIERKVLALGTNHPYLCHLFATFQTDSHLFFVMEYLNGGDLMFHIQQSGRFPEARARFYAAEIVSGLKFLHKRGIVYRDLKLDNILLDFEGHVRIADFGMCKLQIYLDKTADTFCGTPDYMAPEIIKGLKYNQTVDWWSFGVLLYEMLIGQSPFSGCDEDELFWSICNEMPSYPRFLSHEALTILTRLLDKDARTRLGGTECMYGDIREQEFFHPIHWDRLERRELETPFRPRVRHPMDTQYFDRAFTGERPRLTAVEPHVLRSMDQEPFRGFSYTNPNTTDR